MRPKKLIMKHTKYRPITHRNSFTRDNMLHNKFKTWDYSLDSSTSSIIVHLASILSLDIHAALFDQVSTSATNIAVFKDRQ
jgi:hypothetical protein